MISFGKRQLPTTLTTTLTSNSTTLTSNSAYCTNIFFVVDADNIESIKKEEFDAMYCHDLTFTTACSDDSIESVKDDGRQLLVDYEARLEYCQLVKKIRMFEFIDQVCA